MVFKTEAWRGGALTAGGKVMTTPEWLRPGIYGALIGAAFVSIAGFTWGGWVTGGTARDSAMCDVA